MKNDNANKCTFWIQMQRLNKKTSKGLNYEQNFAK